MILVTGATGLVGGNLMWYLLQENDRVIAIRRTTSNLEPLHTIFSFYTPYPDEYLARIDWRIADVLDENSLLQVIAEATIIYHCAAVVSIGNNTDILMDTNVTGTRNIVRAALKTGEKKLCFVSSIAACGRANRPDKVDEYSIWEDRDAHSAYARSKYYSEQEVWKGIDKGLNAVIVNPGVILGVSGSNSGSSQLFTQVYKGLMFYTNGGSGYVDVQDVVRAMMLLTNSGISSDRFIVSSENCSNKDVLSWMADGFGKRRPVIPIGKRLLWTIGIVSELLGRIFHFKPIINRETARSATNREYYSTQKIEEVIGFQFTPVEKCIKDICEFLNK